MTYLGDDGREHRDKGHYRFGRPPARYISKRGCDGWPELGTCSGRAMKGCDYCRDCEALRRAHEGGPAVTDDEDEDDDCNE